MFGRATIRLGIGPHSSFNKILHNVWVEKKQVAFSVKVLSLSFLQG